ncbi:MAG: hypothetical protein IT379_22545 [Deltaproteobacteria bacterium]|nr:hypothetical protein [Deltaproteobacteria bacterium]
MHRTHSIALALCIVGSLAACRHEHDTSGSDAAAPRVNRSVEIVARTPHLPNYPCAEQCHSKRPPNPRQRVLTELHARIRLDHAPVIRWCDFCHAIDDPNHLRLIDGRRISFDESHRLCGQCHGEKAGDWRRNMHGLETGRWDGAALRRTCTACHDPHAPGQITLEALPPPRARTHGGG